MLRDLRHGLRVLMQAKAWTAVVVLSLAVGIGANAVIFSAAHGMLMRKLAVHDPDSLVRLRYAGDNDMVTDSSDYGFSADSPYGRMRTTFSYPMYQHFRVANQTMVDVIASVPFGRLTVLVDGRAETATGVLVSGNFHSLLGVEPRIGRAITPQDDNPSAPPVAMLGERYWRTRFSADPSVLGRVVTVAGIPATIIGVTPAEFSGVNRPLAEPRASPCRLRSIPGCGARRGSTDRPTGSSRSWAGSSRASPPLRRRAISKACSGNRPKPAWTRTCRD